MHDLKNQGPSTEAEAEVGTALQGRIYRPGAASMVDIRKGKEGGGGEGGGGGGDGGEDVLGFRFGEGIYGEEEEHDDDDDDDDEKDSEEGISFSLLLNSSAISRSVRDVSSLPDLCGAEMLLTQSDSSSSSGVGSTTGGGGGGGGDRRDLVPSTPYPRSRPRPRPPPPPPPPPAAAAAVMMRAASSVGLLRSGSIQEPEARRPRKLVRKRTLREQNRGILQVPTR